MLQSITIRQIALIDECTIEFHNGLQVLTGETGAGKSIVVDSVKLILGGRADRELIRNGSEKATVEAVFDVPENPTVRQFMQEEDIEYDGRTVTVFREISLSGRNVCRICGVPVPVARLKELAACLMDVHGQNEQRFLEDPDMHRSFLDQTGSQEHLELLRKLKSNYEAFISNHRIYARLVKQNENRDERLNALERELEQLRNVNIRQGETEELRAERKRLQEAEKETAGLRRIDHAFSGEGAEGSALENIKDASEQLKSLAILNPGLDDLSQRCSDLYFELEEIAYEIRNLIDQSDADPIRLERTEARLDLIRRLERRYGVDANEIAQKQESLQAEYEDLNGLASRIGQLSKEHKQLLMQYRGTARQVTESRKRLAALFEERMKTELQDLGMEKTELKACFRENEDKRPVMPSETGDDHIEFMISPNPGEPLKPLLKIASGGELSRLMLAVKTLEASHTGVDAMVFDEIDTGISGRMAQTVAEKMISISGERQVICVTHLPQIAAAADYQYLVQKATAGERTRTSVSVLDARGREEEIARMISGAEGLTDESLHYAARMLRSAEEIRQEWKAAK